MADVQLNLTRTEALALARMALNFAREIGEDVEGLCTRYGAPELGAKLRSFMPTGVPIRDPALAAVRCPTCGHRCRLWNHEQVAACANIRCRSWSLTPAGASVLEDEEDEDDA